MTYKKLALLLLPIFLLFASTQVKAQGFEGIIYFEVSGISNEGMTEMPYMIKDSKARITVNNAAQSASMLFLPEQSKLVIIMDQMKSYMAIDYEKNLAKNAEEQAEVEVSKTGETKTIAGRTCEVWMMKSTDGTYKTCINDELGAFIMPQSSTFHRNSPSWARKISGGMPLEVLQISEDGKESLVMRATRIEEKALDPALFEVPEGYRDMSSAMKGMMNRFQH